MASRTWRRPISSSSAEGAIRPPSPAYRMWLAGCGLAALGVAAAASGAFRGAVVGERDFARAHAVGGDPPSFDEDGIRFLADRLHRRNGKDPLARTRLVDLLLSRYRQSGRSGDLESARNHLDTLLAEDSLDSGHHRKRSALALADHRFALALAAARRARALAGPDQMAEAVVAEVDALLALSRTPEAASRLDSLPPARPTFALLTRRAQILEASGEPEGAKRVLEEATSRAKAFALPAPTQAWCLTRIGGLAARLGDSRQAASRYREALDLAPGHPEALAGLARLARDADRNTEGARRLFLASLRRGGPPALYLELMRLAKESGNPAEAEGWKARLLAEVSRRPEGTRIHRPILIQAYWQAPDTRQEALRLAWQEVRERPGAGSHDLLAWSLHLAGSIAAAYEVSGKALAEDSRNPLLLYRSAVIAHHAGRLREAEARRLQACALVKPRIQCRKEDPAASTSPETWLALNRDLEARLRLEAHSH